MPNPHVALVLSGGGAKGGVQVGALDYLINHLKYRFDFISGVSVGALNAALLGQDDFPLLSDFWHTITEKDIMRGDTNWYNILWRFWKKRLSIYNNAPLWKLIDKHIDGSKVPVGRKVMVGVVNYETGSSHAVNHRSPYYKKFVLASTAIPLAFPPTKIRHEGETLHYFDGGARNICPLNDVLKYAPDEIVIINCSDPDYLPERKDPPKTMIDLGTRAIDILTNEVFRGDLLAKIHIKCKVHLIEPIIPLGETLDFSRPMLNKRIQHGFERAKAVMG